MSQRYMGGLLPEEVEQINGGGSVNADVMLSGNRETFGASFSESEG